MADNPAPDFSYLRPELQEAIARLSPKEQLEMAALPRWKVERILFDMAVGRAMASTTTLTPEEMAMSDEEFFKHLVELGERNAEDRQD